MSDKSNITIANTLEVAYWLSFIYSHLTSAGSDGQVNVIRRSIAKFSKTEIRCISTYVSVYAALSYSVSRWPRVIVAKTFFFVSIILLSIICFSYIFEQKELG